MRIDSDGQWYHQGGLIKRQALVKLFASILTRLDNGEYWLVTPAERGGIEVDDAPFVITRADIKGTGEAREITLYTNLGDAISLDAGHPMRMAEDGLAARVPMSALAVIWKHGLTAVYFMTLPIWLKKRAAGLFCGRMAAGLTLAPLMIRSLQMRGQNRCSPLMR